MNHKKKYLNGFDSIVNLPSFLLKPGPIFHGLLTLLGNSFLHFSKLKTLSFLLPLSRLLQKASRSQDRNVTAIDIWPILLYILWILHALHSIICILWIAFYDVYTMLSIALYSMNCAIYWFHCLVFHAFNLYITSIHLLHCIPHIIY